MISVAAAKAIVTEETKRLPPRLLPLTEAAGCRLAEEVFAPVDIPGFRQSSVDGYALSFPDHHQPLTLSGELPAGAAKVHSINSAEAARIFTGAPLPDGADTVVMQELCTISDGLLHIAHPDIFRGEHVRPKGSEIQAGELAMARGELMTPAAIGFLAGIGLAQVSVHAPPRVTMIITGNEVRRPGTALTVGEVYDANSFMLQAALRAAGVQNVKILFAEDHLHAVTATLESALQESDIVLLTGGVSVGDYDFVLEATQACGIQQHFHRVKQKPGKPLYFGTADLKMIFGLPGNPSSSLTCFYEYVLPAIDRQLHRDQTIKSGRALLEHAFNKKQGLTQLLKGWFEGDRVRLLHAQESYRLASYAKANCLIVFDEERDQFEAGEPITIHLLPS